MTSRTIEKTDNFRTVIFDPAPTAPEMQELYEKGWTLHMGPFPIQGGKYHSAMFFRAVVPALPAKPLAIVSYDKDAELYSVRDAATDKIVSHSWATWNSAVEDAEAEGYFVPPAGGGGGSVFRVGSSSGGGSVFRVGSGGGFCNPGAGQSAPAQPDRKRYVMGNCDSCGGAHRNGSCQR